MGVRGPPTLPRVEVNGRMAPDVELADPHGTKGPGTQEWCRQPVQAGPIAMGGRGQHRAPVEVIPEEQLGLPTALCLGEPAETLWTLSGREGANIAGKRPPLDLYLATVTK
ncbi:hypothetical protein NDU88_004746 [Pleurodeles waltl]|uniref:Uncharacterized protein n=1 Tax=Pleurodeles waltl TaxID=8319 RepID=A0AAV7QDE1_PLEWA|nr:hypothetical protein NDU88_004746 [Pleurodeles waltl]